MNTSAQLDLHAAKRENEARAISVRMDEIKDQIRSLIVELRRLKAERDEILADALDARNQAIRLEWRKRRG